MEPAKTLPPAEWMNDACVRKIFDALGAGHIMFVGGCVRDWLLNRPVGDIDLATSFLPDYVQKTLKKAGIKTIPTGIDHGTVTAVVDGKGFEITTLRRDVATDGRRATVAYTEDWSEDAARRDFTINALFADERGNVYDPLNVGLSDLEDKKLRFVGDAGERIAEDYLRILRYFRFAAQLGWELDDEAALKACEAAAPKIAELSKERVTQEMLKLLAAKDPTPVLMQMKERAILLELLAGFNAKELHALVSIHPLTRLALINPPLDRLVLSNEQKRHVESLQGAAREFSGAKGRNLKRLVYAQGNDMAYEIYALWCAQKGEELQDALADIAQNWQAPVFELSGEDLIAEGYKPGPELGKELKRREEAWLDSKIKGT